MKAVIANMVVVTFWPSHIPSQGGRFGAGVGRNDLLRHLGGGSLGLRGVVGSIWHFRGVFRRRASCCRLASSTSPMMTQTLQWGQSDLFLSRPKRHTLNVQVTRSVKRFVPDTRKPHLPSPVITGGLLMLGKWRSGGHGKGKAKLATPSSTDPRKFKLAMRMDEAKWRASTDIEFGKHIENKSFKWWRNASEKPANRRLVNFTWVSKTKRDGASECHPGDDEVARPQRGHHLAVCPVL